MNQRISDLCSDILGGVFNSEDETCEVQSSEDLISRIEDLNGKIRAGEVDSGHMMTGSLDVEALYPSIDVKKAGEICRDKVLESELNLEGIDYRWALVYLALTQTPTEKVDLRLQGVIPRRLAKTGSRPTIKTVEKDEQVERWWYPVPPNQLST